MCALNWMRRSTAEGSKSHGQKSQNLYFSWWNLHIGLLRGQQQVIFTVRYWAILPSVAVPCSRHAFQGPSPRWNLPESSRGCKWRVEKNTMHLVYEPSRQLQGRRGDSVRPSLQRRLALGLLSCRTAWADSLKEWLAELNSLRNQTCAPQRVSLLGFAQLFCSQSQ